MAERSAADVARDNGIDPKELRRYLRVAPSWNNPGTGRRYKFTPSDEATLIKGFRAWKVGRQPVTRNDGE